MGPPAPVGEARGRATASGSAAGEGGHPSACEERGHGHGVQPRRGWAVGSRRGSTRRWWRGRVSQEFLPSRSGRCPGRRWGRGSGRPRRRPSPRGLAGRSDQPAARHGPDHGVGAVGPLVGPEPGDPGVRRWFGRLRHGLRVRRSGGRPAAVEGAGPAPPVRQGGVGRPSPAGTHGTPGGAAPPGRTRPPPPGPGSGRASLPSAPRGNRTSTSSRKGPRRPLSPQS